MKKLFLLIAGSCVAFGASAQSQLKGVPFNKAIGLTHKQEVMEGKTVLPATALGTANKTTSATERWYSPFDEYDQLAEPGVLTDNRMIFPIWFDSTVQQRFNTGLSRINYSSVGQLIDPISSEIVNEPTAFSGEVKIGVNNTYTVDSVNIMGSYVKVPSRPDGIVDTLIFSVVPAPGLYYYMRKNDPNYGAKVAQYTDLDTLQMFSFLTDSVNRAGLAPAGGNAITWKVPLFDADRDTVNIVGGQRSWTLKDFTFPVPNGGLTIPAGNRFGVTCTFKSGDTWAANVDSVTSRHHFLVMAAATGDSKNMPNVLKNFKDRSMSQLMFSFDTSAYIPSMMIEIWNANTFNQEFIRIAGHAKCTGCFQVGINETNGGVISAANAYPNPANENVTVKFSLYNAADATVSIMNAVGQVVATQNLNNVREGKATFSTANLNSGVYFYNVEANGQRTTKRFVVAH